MRRIVSARRPRLPSGWLASVAGWLVCTAAATAIGILAVSAIGAGITGPDTHPLSHDEVREHLAAEPSTPSTTVGPSMSASPAAAPTSNKPTAPASTGRSKVLGSKGGSTVARCVNGQAELVSWSPAQGYEVDDLRRGPANTARIQFESDDIEINLHITCVDGVPASRITVEHD